MASTSITIRNLTPYTLQLRAATFVFQWWVWPLPPIGPGQTYAMPCEWWWYDISATADFAEYWALYQIRQKYAQKAGQPDPLGEFVDYKAQSYPGIYSTGSIVGGVYGGSTVTLRPNKVDEKFTAIARTVDPSATFYELSPPVLIDGGKPLGS